jgi:hypothetical protein
LVGTEFGIGEPAGGTMYKRLFVGHPERDGVIAGYCFGRVRRESQFAWHVHSWLERDDREALAVGVQMVKSRLPLGF